MSNSDVFIICLMCAEYIVLGFMAGVAFRKDIKKWVRKKFREAGWQ